MNQAVLVTPPAAPAVVPDKKRDVSAIPQSMGLAEAKRRDFVLDVPEEHSRTDLLDPSYWAHVARDLAPFDRIEARAETGEWFSELVVVSAGRNFAIVRELSHFDMTGQATASAPVEMHRHAVQWKGSRKFCVVRLSDKAIISEGHHARHDADSALIEYENRIAAS
jgi:hypothetical protein